jgi:hypothetical protein
MIYSNTVTAWGPYNRAEVYVSMVRKLIIPSKLDNFCTLFGTRGLSQSPIASYIFFVIPFYLQSVLVHSANCVKTCIQWHVEECSVALLCN